MSEQLTETALHTAHVEMVVPPPAFGSDATIVIQQLLAAPREALEHGATFTGRPTTWLYRNDQHVLKIHTEYRFTARDARRWIEHTAAVEQQIRAHHPDKGWLLLHLPDMTLLGSLTPLLTPVHHLIAVGTETECCAHLEGVLALYLRVAAEHQRRLDEGLSNFALTADGHLYYVDDDLYPWDTFLSLAQALGFWLRAFPWCSANIATHLGSVLRQLLSKHCHERHVVDIVAGQIRRLYVANPEQKQRREALLCGLEAVTAQTQPRLRLHCEPIALLADIHANYPALQAVLHELETLGVRQAMVLGDTVGYGPHPRQVIQAVKERGFLVIKGNHDYAISEGQYNYGFSMHAKQVGLWTHEQLTAEDLAWLDALPLTLQQDEWLAVHGAPQDTRFFYGYVYQTTYESNLDNLAEREIPICFHGHSHIAGVYFRSKHGLHGHRKQTQLSLSQYSHCLVNPGSVGQPRENNGNAARFAVFNPADTALTFYSVVYDIATTVHDMQAYDFPAPLIQRLQDGV